MKMVRTPRDERQTRHNYSQLTEKEKAKIQTPFTYNDQRNFVECNPVKKISDDLVYPTKDTSSASILSELEEREEIAEDVPTPADISCTHTCTCRHTGDSRGTTLHSRIKKVNEEEPWKASQYI